MKIRKRNCQIKFPKKAIKNNMLGTKTTEQGKKQERAKFHVAFPWQKN